jgi:hypothetical protein
MTIPPELGSSWEEFFEEWCCGQTLGSRSEIESSLSTLKRLIPEEIEERVGDGVRGPGAVAPMVELGRLLKICESVDGFQDVLRRLRTGEWSAYPELVVVATLKGLGFDDLRFGPVLSHRIPDAVCQIDGVSVYFEVVAPEESEATAEQGRMIKELLARVEDVGGYRVEIDVLQSIGPEDIEAIAATVPVTAPNTWVQVGSSARIRRVRASPQMPPLLDDPAGVQVATLGNSGLVVHWDPIDDRAKRLLWEKYQQLVKDSPNILVMELSAVRGAGGWREWPRVIAEQLTPHRYRTVGAVVLYHQAVGSGAPDWTWREWRVLVNEHAHESVPTRLVDALRTLRRKGDDRQLETGP